MGSIPRAAALLTALGALPFLAGALMAMLGWEFHYKSGQDILASYSWVIMSFMGGCLWGFAAKAETDGLKWYGISVLPALYAFFVSDHGLLLLAAGFVALLGLDWLFQRAGLAPIWWMRLRIPVSLVVILCLVIGAIQ